MILGLLSALLRILLQFSSNSVALVRRRQVKLQLWLGTTLTILVFSLASNEHFNLAHARFGLQKFTQLEVTSARTVQDREDNMDLLLAISKHTSFTIPAKANQVSNVHNQLSEMQTIVGLIEQLIDLSIDENDVTIPPDVDFA